MKLSTSLSALVLLFAISALPFLLAASEGEAQSPRYLKGRNNQDNADAINNNKDENRLLEELDSLSWVPVPDSTFQPLKDSEDGGWTITMSGDGTMMAAGPRNYNGVAKKSGIVRFFSKQSGGSWVEMDSIFGAEKWDSFGHDVAFSEDGTRIAIGAWGMDGPNDNSPRMGGVSVYEMQGGSWVLMGQIIHGEAKDDQSGRAVAMSQDGSIVAIGALRNDGNGNDSGQVRVFKWNGSSFFQLGADIDGEAAGDRSGSSVALSDAGTTVAIGSTRNDDAAKDAGHVRVFDWSGSDESGTWTQRGSDVDGDAEDDESGFSVDLSGDGNVLAIGAKLAGPTDKGQVKVFQWKDGDWQQVGQTLIGSSTDSQIGTAVAFAANGCILAVGSPLMETPMVYKLEGGTTWEELAGPVGSDPAAEVALSMDGTTIAVGDPEGSGEVSLYNLSGPLEDFECSLGGAAVPESPSSAPTPVPESPSSAPTPVPESPSSAPTPVPESPSSAPTPVPELPSSAPTPVPESPSSAPTPVPESPSSAPTPVPESPSSAPTPVPESPSSAPTPVPESPSSAPSSSPSSTPEAPTAGTSGDPHFKTWKGEHFEYHGQCDMILAKDDTFADGLGLDMQIRTKLVRYWSYIHRAAIRIGDDILEVEGTADDLLSAENNHYWINFEYQGELKTIGGFPIKYQLQDSNQVKRWFEIDLSSKYPGQKIVISSFKEFVRMDYKNGSAESVGNAVGMLGNFHTGKTLARDAATELHDFSMYGNEWQVLPHDAMLFHDVSMPQFPKKCLEPEDPQGERRRRLDESSITEEEAEAACASLPDPMDRKDCVYDIIATQDMGMVGAY